jgi:hypothetical protein
MTCKDSEAYEDNQAYVRSVFHGSVLKANNIMRLLDVV